MAEFMMDHHRRDSDSDSDETIASYRSLDPPPSFNRYWNRSERKRTRHDATLINPGPPALYRLKTEREYIDVDKEKVRRWTYGKIDKNKQKKVILLIGETGAGKTTMINTMINYLLGVKFEDKEWYEITEEYQDQSQSQTSAVTVYEVFVEENQTSLTIIDTPGYGHTGGFKREREISEYLAILFSDEDGIHYIDAVCFVMKASQNRLSGKELYMLLSVLSLFGRDIENNIVFLLTHSDGGPPTDALSAINKAQIHCRRDERKTPIHFLFNNQQKEKRDKQFKRIFRSAWDMGERSMNELLKLLEENNRKSVQMTLDVLTESKRLEARVSYLMDRINEKDLKIKELNQIQEALRQNRDKIEKGENFEFTVNRVFKVQVPTQQVPIQQVFTHLIPPLFRAATSCNICQETCHDEWGCWYVSPSDLSKCDVMYKGQCTVCLGMCHHSKHVKERKKYVMKTSETKMTFDKLKQEYECTGEKPETSFDIKTNTGKEHESNMKESLNKTEIEEKLIIDLEKIKTQKSIMLHEVYMIIMKLCEIPLKSGSYLTLEHLDSLINTMKKEGEDERVENLMVAWEYIIDCKNKTCLMM